MRHAVRIPVIIFLVIPILLTACQGDRSVTEPAPPVLEEPTIGTMKTPVSEPSFDIIPTPREELEATDPSTVVLTSGKPTLVEFFAFW